MAQDNYQDDDAKVAELLSDVTSPVQGDPDEARAAQVGTYTPHLIRRYAAAQDQQESQAAGTQQRPTAQSPDPQPDPATAKPEAAKWAGVPWIDQSDSSLLPGKSVAKAGPTPASYSTRAMEGLSKEGDAAAADEADAKTSYDSYQRDVADQTAKNQQIAANAPNPNAYKPKMGTRILRGLEGAAVGLAKGGVLGAAAGAVAPSAVGMKAYGAPTDDYDRDTQIYDNKVKQGQTNIADLASRYKSFTDLQKQRQAARTQATTAYKDAGSTATAQETADNTADKNGAAVKAAQAKLDAQADRVPKTYEEAVAAASLETDPTRKASLDAAVKRMEATEVRKFQAAARAGGGTGNPQTDDKRKAFIDDATAAITELQNKYEYDPVSDKYTADNGNTVLTPEEYTAQKNKLATDLDKKLTTAKMRPLGVRFNPQDAHGTQFRNQPQQPQSAAAAPPPQPSAVATAPVTPQPRQAPQPTAAPQQATAKVKAGTLKVGDPVQHNGKTGKVISINPQTGKPVVQWGA